MFGGEGLFHLRLTYIFGSLQILDWTTGIIGGLDSFLLCSLMMLVRYHG